MPRRDKKRILKDIGILIRGLDKKINSMKMAIEDLSELHVHDLYDYEHTLKRVHKELEPWSFT